MGKILKNHEEKLEELDKRIGYLDSFANMGFNNLLSTITNVAEKINAVEFKLDLLIKTLGYELQETPAKKEFVKTKK